MIISNHHIQNVLKLYTSQQSKGRLNHSQGETVRKPLADAIDISANGKRQALVERLTKTIVGRIVRKDPRMQSEEYIVEQMKNELEGNYGVRQEGQKQEITYNVIDKDAAKTLHTLSMRHPGDLIKQLEHQVREAVEKNLE